MRSTACAPICRRCRRKAVGWSLERPDLCNVKRAVYCIRDPYDVIRENAGEGRDQVMFGRTTEVSSIRARGTGKLGYRAVCHTCGRSKKYLAKYFPLPYETAREDALGHQCRELAASAMETAA